MTILSEWNVSPGEMAWLLRDSALLLPLVCAGMAAVVWRNWRLGSGE